MVGKTISHYRILSVLGKGGMGVVYKAEDIRLGRMVAVKFLPEEMARDHTALERFRREARAVSALNHANICTLHDIDLEAEQPFLVMEFIEGQTLRHRILERPIQVDELVDLGIQITDALDIAHAGRIVHRDIKPANILLTPRGQIKVMDFGLAKMDAERNGPDSGDDASTIASDFVTSAGSTIGTVAYMSPEQARGEKLDVRSDLFSLGVVLYEMATGKTPFHGTTTAMTFVAILNQACVPPTQLRPELPPELERIIHKALEKDRDMRYQSAADIRADLKRLRREIGTLSSTSTVGVADSGSCRGRAGRSAEFSEEFAQQFLGRLRSCQRGPRDRCGNGDADRHHADFLLTGSLQRRVHRGRDEASPLRPIPGHRDICSGNRRRGLLLFFPRIAH